MNDGQKIALRLVLLIFVGSALSFSPSAISVTQKIQNAQSAFEAKDYQLQANILMDLAGENSWWKSLWEKAGDAAFKAGDYSRAITSYENASEINTLSVNGKIQLGEAYQSSGDFERAESSWQDLELTAEALTLLAALYEEQGDITSAVDTWERYLAAFDEGDNLDIIFHFGLLMAAESPPEALVYLDQSAENYPAAESLSIVIRGSLLEETAYQYVTTGQALAANEYWQLAAYSFEKAAVLRPDYMEAFLYWGEALQHIPNPDEDAREILEKGLALDDLAPLANLFLGLYWQRIGSHNQALEYFQIAEESWPDRPDVYIEQGRSLAVLGELESALEKYQQAIEIAPLDDIYHRQLADFCVLYSYQIRSIGLPAVRIAVQLNNQDPANLDSMGQVLLNLDDQMNAIQFFQGAINIDPTYAPAYYHLGILYSARNETDLAVYYLQQVLTYTKNPAIRDQAERLLSSY
jgi:tetratricopeptide (TPR) repeat protein